jgi:hypothetical protein
MNYTGDVNVSLYYMYPTDIYQWELAIRKTLLSVSDRKVNRCFSRLEEVEGIWWEYVDLEGCLRSRAIMAMVM